MRAEPETLRVALDRIMSIQFPTVFQSAFDEVQREYGHTIRIIPGDKKWLETFNCYAFALGIVDSPRYQTLVQKHCNGALANSHFMSALLACGELTKIDEARVRVGNLVLYLAEGRLTHAGIVFTGSQRVRSKWGPNELYEHALWEVPQSYGGQKQFVDAPDKDRITDLLERYMAQLQ
jgi:hypothetical protein